MTHLPSSRRNTAGSGRYRLLAGGILGCFLLLALTYSLVSPIFENLDEIPHFGYVKYVADGFGLPVQRPGQETIYEQEGSQPPLYYVLGAALVSWVDTDDLPLLLVRNPYARIGIGLTADNQNMVLHTDAEAWPWHGTALAFHLLRFYSIALAAGSAWGVYVLGRQIAPARPMVAVGAMALTAFNPMFIYLAASINNDNLIILLSTWTLVQLITLLQKGVSTKRLIMLGMTLGLAAIAKVSGLALGALVVLAVLVADLGAEVLVSPAVSFSGSNRPVSLRKLRSATCHALLTVGVAAIVGSWWYIRNLGLYGELTGVQTMLQIFGQRTDAFAWLAAWEELKGFLLSYWGLFGGVNVVLRPNSVVWVLQGVLLLGWIPTLWQLFTGRIERQRTVELLLLISWVVVLHMSLLHWTLMTPASQGRLVFPAIGAISVIVAFGLDQLRLPRHWPQPLGIVGGALLLLSISVPWTTLAPAYAPPLVLTANEIPSDAQPLGVTFEDSVELVAYELSEPVSEPGQEIWVTLYWRAVQPLDEDLTMYLHLFGRDAVKIGFRDSYAGMGKYLTRNWKTGEIVRDVYALKVDPQAEGPVAARLEVGLYRQGEYRLAAVDALGQPVDPVILGRVKVTGITDVAAPQYSLETQFAQGVQLLGYDLPSNELQPGDAIPVVLHWQTAPLDADYQVFVHLVAADGALVGQGDGPPLQGDYPTVYWGAGEHILDEHLLSVDAQAPPGEAFIYVGLYELDDGHRLPVVTGGDADNRVCLGRVSVQRP